MDVTAVPFFDEVFEFFDSVVMADVRDGSGSGSVGASGFGLVRFASGEPGREGGSW